MSAAAKARLCFVAEVPNLPHLATPRRLAAIHEALYPNWSQHRFQVLSERLEIDQRARIDSLSKGQRRRANLILALASQPDLLLLDEPGSGLDVAGRRELLSLLAEWLAGGDGQRSLVFSTHIVTDVERIASDVSILARGRLVFDAALDDVHEQIKRIRMPAEQCESLRLEGELAGALECHRGPATVEFVTQHFGALRERLGLAAPTERGPRGDAYDLPGGRLEVGHVSLEDAFLLLSAAPASEEATA